MMGEKYIFLNENLYELKEIIYSYSAYGENKYFNYDDGWEDDNCYYYAKYLTHYNCDNLEELKTVFSDNLVKSLKDIEQSEKVHLGINKRELSRKLKAIKDKDIKKQYGVGYNEEDDGIEFTPMHYKKFLIKIGDHYEEFILTKTMIYIEVEDELKEATILSLNSKKEINNYYV